MWSALRGSLLLLATLLYCWMLGGRWRGDAAARLAQGKKFLLCSEKPGATRDKGS